MLIGKLTKKKKKTSTATEENVLTPSEMKFHANTGTGLAYNNYERFVQILAGKNTFHDTADFP